MVVNKLDRAKQFLPFDALKGFQEALRQKEEEFEERKELSEESCLELSSKINEIEIGETIKLKYYKYKKYIEVIGVITKIDFIKKKIQLNRIENINFCDIVNIERNI